MPESGQAASMNTVMPKDHLGSTKLAMLIDWTLKNTANADISVQHGWLWVALFHTGADPLVFVPAEASTRAFCWRDSEIRPRRIEGQVVGHDVKLTVRSQVNDSAPPTVYFLETVKDEEELILDPGNWIMAHGLRHGVFGAGVTMEDLWRTNKDVITVKEEFLDQPMFWRRSVSGLQRGAQLLYKEANDRLDMALRGTGLKRNDIVTDLTCFGNHRTH